MIQLNCIAFEFKEKKPKHLQRIVVKKNNLPSSFIAIYRDTEDGFYNVSNTSEIIKADDSDVWFCDPF